MLLVLALLLAAIGYLGVGAGRQFLADRAFTPIRVPAPTAPAPGHRLAAVRGRRRRRPSPPAGRTPPIPTPAGVAAALAGRAGRSRTRPVGGRPGLRRRHRGAAVRPAVLGGVVAPASTAKLLTAAAVLSVRQATDRFGTQVVAGAEPGTVVLVGGGDPTLSAAPAGKPTRYPESGPDHRPGGPGAGRPGAAPGRAGARGRLGLHRPGRRAGLGSGRHPVQLRQPDHRHHGRRAAGTPPTPRSGRRLRTWPPATPWPPRSAAPR